MRPESVSDIEVRECRASEFTDVDFVFSGLDSSIATEVERDFASSGIPVISNVKNYRTDPTVPLLVAEVNPDHTDLISSQTFTEDGKGWIVTNPNCVAIPLTMILKHLYSQFGIESVIATTILANLGSVYPSIPILNSLGNVVPFNGD